MSRGGYNGSMFEIMREFAACLRLGQLLWAAAMPSVTMGVSAEKYRAEKLRTGLIPLERARVTFATRHLLLKIRRILHHAELCRSD